MMPEVLLVSLATPGATIAASAGGGALSITIVELIGWSATALGGIAIIIGGLVKIFKKNGGGSSPAAAPAATTVTDPVLLEKVGQLVERTNETHASTMDLRDSHVTISRDLGKIEGKIDIIITLLRPVKPTNTGGL